VSLKPRSPPEPVPASSLLSDGTQTPYLFATELSLGAFGACHGLQSKGLLKTENTGKTGKKKNTVSPGIVFFLACKFSIAAKKEPDRIIGTQHWTLSPDTRVQHRCLFLALSGKEDFSATDRPGFLKHLKCLSGILY
jgi:hypothetical protein